MPDMDKAIGELVLIIVGFSGLALAIFSLAYAIPLMAIGFGGWAAHKWYTNNPSVLERRARSHTHKLYQEALKLSPDTLSREEFGTEVYIPLRGKARDELADCLIKVAIDLYDAENFSEPIPPPPLVCNSMEGARYRDFLSAHTAKITHVGSAKAAVKVIQDANQCLLDRLPETPPALEPWFQIGLVDVLPDIGEAIQEYVAHFYDDVPGVFVDLRKQLDYNACTVSGLEFSERNRQSEDLILPADYEGENIAYAYLRDTPLLQVFNAQVPYAANEDAWFEHAWCLAPPGTGKSQLIQHIVSSRLTDVMIGECSVVVIDSQGDLIRNIRMLKHFAPGDLAHDNLLIIEPSLEHPPALNLFDFGRERLKTYSREEKEKVTAIAINQMTYVLGALMGEAGAMTTKQETLYRYIMRLLIEMPGSTLSTFSDILNITKPAELVPYGRYIDALSPAAQDFFANQFLDREFSGTKKQVAWRIANLRENAYFESMFSHKQSKLDLFLELNEPRVILIDTSKEKLGDDGTNVFGRYFIGALLSASQERAALSHGERLRVYCFVDEAQDYISTDTKIATLYDQARKMRISMFMAHQRTRQISNRDVLDALSSAAVKFVSTDNPHDADIAAKAMHTTRDFIIDQPRQHFALHVRRQGAAVSVEVPFFEIEKMAKMSPEEAQAVNEKMWARLSSDEPEAPERSASETDDAEEPDTDDSGGGDSHDPDHPPDKPSPEL